MLRVRPKHVKGFPFTKLYYEQEGSPPCQIRKRSPYTFICCTTFSATNITHVVVTISIQPPLTTTIHPADAFALHRRAPRASDVRHPSKTRCIARRPSNTPGRSRSLWNLLPAGISPSPHALTAFARMGRAGALRGSGTGRASHPGRGRSSGVGDC
jgi:hypothetical protein